MLNEHVFGGYLIWSMPERKVFIDGRGDVFEWTGIFDEYENWILLQSDPSALLKKHHVARVAVADRMERGLFRRAGRRLRTRKVMQSCLPQTERTDRWQVLA
jgi:hypothetical protein